MTKFEVAQNVRLFVAIGFLGFGIGLLIWRTLR